MSDLKRGDKVKVTFEGTYVKELTSGKHLIKQAPPVGTVVPADADIQVITPVDHPSRDLPGTVRKSPNLGIITIKVGPNDWRVIGSTSAGRSYADNQMTLHPIIDTVPGSEASEGLR